MSTRFPIPLRQAARMLGLGPNKLFRALRERRVLDRNNLPYRSYVDRGLFTTKLKGYQHQVVGQRPYAVTHVTARGLNWLAREFDVQIAQEQAHQGTTHQPSGTRA
ncbi:phage antirepressor KilAC domain-containing protein [Marinobacter sp. M1N3S26]|uniref:phage antirepressor KilAC domain-containing protein n=1 Tax=Marinobacter sp. M1N3S26 TaxID=3382299 RepID=UPI00387AD15A